jgi:TetR/AcrR family transcriptional regulator, cholesterol catabolism regulator
LYATATRLFATQGYPSTSFDEIAREVGIHKSTIFHYVSNKQELLATILDRGLSGYVSSLETIANRDEDGLARLFAATRNHLNFVFEHSLELRIFLRDRQHLRGKKGQSYLRMSQRYQETFTEIIQDGMRDGTIVDGDATLMCLFLLGSANWIVEWFRPGGRLTAADIIDHFLRSVVSPMMASPGQAPAGRPSVY